MCAIVYLYAGVAVHQHVPVLGAVQTPAVPAAAFQRDWTSCRYDASLTTLLYRVCLFVFVDYCC